MGFSPLYSSFSKLSAILIPMLFQIILKLVYLYLLYLYCTFLLGKGVKRMPAMGWRVLVNIAGMLWK